MDAKPMDLYEFLVDSELQHYYNSIKNELKISLVSHLKYATDEDLKQVGLSKPEIRRLRKYYEKVYPHGYLSKIKRLLQNPAKKEDGTLMNSTTSLEPIKVSTSPSKISNNKHIIPADSICVNKQLGTGEFGIVQQGVWTNGNERIQVAIKCLCRERMQSNPMEFLKEAAIMHAIEHENIVRLYGVVLDTDSLMLVTELAHLRSLLECLKDPGLRVSFLTVPTLCEFAAQICNGMQYLESKRLIHRDLAARNILVFSKNKVKISDFGLSRALGVGKDYYQTNFNVNLKLPIAWCAPECINFLRFTNASDVWAYGVCLWEMFSYGFQPWAALTGHQILEAIDEPNYQRLEAPECCPREYYNLMLRCWQHDPLKRPKFTEIGDQLPDMRPEQVKTVQSYAGSGNGGGGAGGGGGGADKKDHLMYRQNEIISVLDKTANPPYWKGVLNSGKTGLFNPANTVTHLATSLPSSSASTTMSGSGSGAAAAHRDSFSRTADRSSKRKLRTEMISNPQNDLKHTGHVGLDGAYFGDVAFMSSSSAPQTYNHLPRQIVTPYKPSEDIEQTPLLLPPTPTSPDSLQTASGYFPQHASHLGAGAVGGSTRSNGHHGSSVDGGSGGDLAFGSAFNFASEFTSSNPFAVNGGGRMQLAESVGGGFTNANVEEDGGYGKTTRKPGKLEWPQQQHHPSSSSTTAAAAEASHEYHEISDDEIAADKVFDMGPSLLDEMDFMFRSLKTADADGGPTSIGGDHHHHAAAGGAAGEPTSPALMIETNTKNEIAELTSKLQQTRRQMAAGASATLGGKGKKSKAGGVGGAGSMKPISVKDERILNQAIDYVNEISARSMTDLVSDPPVAQSPKRKFSFRFPNLSTHAERDGSSSHRNGVEAGSGLGSTGGLTHGNGRNRNFSEELNNVPDLQNTITEECREAYNILVEKSVPSSTMGAFDFVKPSLNAASSSNTATFPRPSSSSGSGFAKPQQPKKPSRLDLSGLNGGASTKVPRPTTLPHRTSTAAVSAMSTDTAESNPLRILRDKNFPIIRPRMKTTAAPNGGRDTVDNDALSPHSPCESPSYILHTATDHHSTAYSFSERDVHAAAAAAEHHQPARPDASLNPVPLPPRDRNKVMQTNVKRHVRKYPLIIPVAGLQRNLSKVTSPSPVEEQGAPQFPDPETTTLPATAAATASAQPINATKPDAQHQHNGYLTQRFIENNFPSASASMSSMSSATASAAIDVDHHHHRTYENMDTLRHMQQMQQHAIDCTDSASLHFESILEDGCHLGDAMASPEVNKDFMFDIQKDHQLYRQKAAAAAAAAEALGADAPDEIRNLDIEAKKLEFAQRYPKFGPPQQNELASHSLFNKVKELAEVVASSSPVPDEVDALDAVSDEPLEAECVDGAIADGGEDDTDSLETRALQHSNSVSCEDLLEFSDQKPKGRERGVESDEVRIMTKVLGTTATPAQFIETLDFIDWNVHKAIKLVMLRKTLADSSLTLQQCVDALQSNEWDMQMTTLKLKTGGH